VQNRAQGTQRSAEMLEHGPVRMKVAAAESGPAYAESQMHVAYIEKMDSHHGSSPIHCSTFREQRCGKRLVRSLLQAAALPPHEVPDALFLERLVTCGSKQRCDLVQLTGYSRLATATLWCKVSRVKLQLSHLMRSQMHRLVPPAVSSSPPDGKKLRSSTGAPCVAKRLVLSLLQVAAPASCGPRHTLQSKRVTGYS
jgi:hypothetical protein